MRTPKVLHCLVRIAQDIDSAQRFVHSEYFATSRAKKTENIFEAMKLAPSQRYYRESIKIRGENNV